MGRPRPIIGLGSKTGRMYVYRWWLWGGDSHGLVEVITIELAFRWVAGFCPRRDNALRWTALGGGDNGAVSSAGCGRFSYPIRSPK